MLVSRYPQQDAGPSGISSGDGPFVFEDMSPNAHANMIYQHYYTRLLAVATTKYRWLGLGAWVDPMRVEWLLCTKGLCAFTFVRQDAELPTGSLLFNKDATWSNKPNNSPQLAIQSDRFTVVNAYITGTLDDTFTPSGYRTFTPNGANGISFNTNLPLEQWKGVPIWGDSLRSRYEIRTVTLFAIRLASAALVVDVNLRMTTRGAVVVTGKQDKLLTMQTLTTTALAGVDTYVANDQDLSNLKALDLGVHPDTVERSHVVAMRLWAEALEALGVEAPAAEKKERMVVDEVGADRSQVSAIRRLTLTPRKQAASLINRRYFGGEPVVEVVDQWE